MPTADRHTEPAAANPSAGQADEVPVHVSVTSHAPTDERQMVPASMS
jgi:hypothetical protein